MTISAIIVSYNTCELTCACLRALFQDIEGISSEVWVVDNASEDGSVEAIHREFPTARIIANSENIGFGAANNIAIRQATGEYLLLLNSDAFVKPGAVRALVSCLQAYASAAVAGPRLLNPDGTL